MLLLDRLFADPWFPAVPKEYRAGPDIWIDYVRRLRSELPKAIAFEISNVAEYFYMGAARDQWDYFSDFPGAMPPFENTWMEWIMPRQANRDGLIETLPSAGVISRCGSLIASENNGDYLKLNILTFQECGATILQTPTILFRVSKVDGTVAPPTGLVNDLAFAVIGADARSAGIADSPAFPELSSDAKTLNFPAMLALSLLNCRNVTLREQNNSRQLVRNAERHNTPITKSYRVIEIQPIRIELAKATGKEGYSRDAASIIRGHFKDYSHGSGLFGKIKGRFWWGQQVHGEIVRSREFHYELAQKGPGSKLDPQWLKRRRA